MTTESQKITVLFLSADPDKRPASSSILLRTDREYRDVSQSIELSDFRDKYELKFQPALRTIDLQQALLKYSPHIVHFSGHGTPKSDIVLENPAGGMSFVDGEALAELFQLQEGITKGVILNSCYSLATARAISKHVDFVVGMKGSIDDRAAIAFSTGFYRSLAFGKSVGYACRAGINQMKLEGFKSDSKFPKLYCRGKNEDEIKLVLKQPTIITFADSEIAKSIKGDIGGGLRSWEANDDIVLILKNDWFDSIQVISIDGKWWPIDNKHLESELSWAPEERQPLPRLIEKNTSARFKFELTPKEIKRSGLPINEYPLKKTRSYLKAAYLIYSFRVEYKPKNGHPIVRVYSYSYPNEKVVISQLRNTGSDPNERSDVMKFSKLAQEAHTLRSSDFEIAIDKYYSALLKVPGFWDSGTEEHKLISRIWLWTLLMQQALHWGTAEIKKPEYVEKAKSIFRDDSAFYDACRSLRMDFLFDTNLAAAIFCWSLIVSIRPSVDDRQNWLKKAEAYANIASSTTQKNHASEATRRKERILRMIAKQLAKYFEEQIKP